MKSANFWANRFAGSFLLLVIGASVANGQSSVFTYQGKLIDGGAPTNSSYDMRFSLFDAETGGTQLGATFTANSVQASVGIFSVEIDFGAAPFSGPDRFLEVAISPAGQGSFTTLAPRQRLNSAPYSLKSLNAETSSNSLNLGGTAAAQFVLTNDIRMSDARTPLPGSGDYIQNGTSAQPGINFNIGGTGTATIFDAATQFSIGGSRILSNAGTENLFAGSNAGLINDKGTQNAFFGHGAGMTNSNGTHNTFTGANTGRVNTGGSGNSFFGANAGRSNLLGFNNSFFGMEAGLSNVFGQSNTFIGRRAGFQNTNGEQNTFIGDFAGQSNTTGGANVFLGVASGFTNTTGSGNVFIGGGGTENGNIQVNQSIAIGFGSLVSRNNSIAIGSQFHSSVGIAAGPVTQANTIVVGTTSQKTLVDGRFRTGTPFGISAGDLPGRGYMETFFVTNTFQGIYTPNVIFGSFTANPRNAVIACVHFQGVPGQTAGVILTNCLSPLSSVNDKTEVEPFTGGLDIVRRLEPVSFRHKENGGGAIGLNAEDVEKIDASLVQRDDKASVFKVSETGLNMVLINAVKQQQELIETQQQKIRHMQTRIDALVKHICTEGSESEICKEN